MSSKLIDIHVIVARLTAGEMEGATSTHVALSEENAYAIVCDLITEHVAGKWHKYDQLSRWHLHEYAEARAWDILNEWNHISALWITHEVHTLTGSEQMQPKLVVDYECKQTEDE